jgi:hypothetical protein
MPFALLQKICPGLVVGKNLVDKKVDTEEKRDAAKDTDRNQRTSATVVIHLRDQIASGDVKRHAACQRKGVCYRRLELCTDE